ncbi:T cell activation RhoGTPase activating protein b isoform X1 [Megalops cyprinoides]|uniref:T cell activation RhoGTPase activating protein b isoform X1 n=1 Tax=Megalops cyprinoides TaxID=118141 RepID=UPI001864C057|nr:T cell activation RhoGTPase activating protein b isoform X1 [Megalops cyprinoides]
MTVLSGSITCKTLTGGGMDSVIEQPSDGNVKTLPHSEQLCNTEERTCHPIENGSSSKWSLIPKLLRKGSSQSSPAHCPEPATKTPLFGQVLSKVCDDNDRLPKPITEILMLLLKKGTFTEGVFRKPGNARNLKEIREQLNGGVEVELGAAPVILLAALFKDFLRQLPGSLLVADQYKAWMAALEKEDDQERCNKLKQVIDKLPRANILLLQHLLCVLHHISKNADANKMTAKNLAVCIAPNLLQRDNLPLDRETVDKVTALTQYLIENCCKIFGEHIQTLLGDPDEEELVDNSDSLSSHQHDSAYDSTDPDADGDVGVELMESRPHPCHSIPQSTGCKDDRPAVPSCSSSAIFQTFTKPFNRRSSEPAIFHTTGMTNLRGLARSHDDFSLDKESFKEQPLKKQTSDDSFLMHRRSKRGQLLLQAHRSSWASDLPASRKDDSCSSSCSLESSFSNQSENSVFTSSPLASPSCPRKPLFSHHQSFSAKAVEEVPAQSKEVKRRTQSMKTESKNPRRVRSWSSFARASFKKGEPQKEATFPCETLQEDSQSEAEPAEPPVRPRPLSAIAVFQQVDSRIPGKPPSYKEAILSGLQPPPPQYHAMTVQGARELERKSRPSSVSEDSLYSVLPVNTFMDCFPQTPDSGVEDMPAADPHQLVFRQRAMSESVSRTRHEKLNRRCSQPLFEEMSYAKESYV